MAVTELDRQMAADLAPPGLRSGILSGSMDSGKYVQAFMRHRLAAEERGARMALEAAAKVFEAEADTWVQTPLRGAMKRKGATAIRQIDPAQIVKGQSDAE